MGWTIQIHDEEGKQMCYINTNGHYDTVHFPIANLTWNFSKEMYMKYWYGPKDLHEKTVDESIQNIRRAISDLVADGYIARDIPYNRSYEYASEHDKICFFLDYLVRQYKFMKTLPGNYKLSLF